jgi:hypothetical protein
MRTDKGEKNVKRVKLIQKVATTKKQRGASGRILHSMGEGCI